MSIIRTVRKESFTPIDNDLLNDTTITFRAKGLLCYLISRPPNWNANVVHLSRTFKEGRDAIYSILGELIEAGYVDRVISRTTTGQHLSTEYHVFEKKNRDRVSLLTEKPETVEPVTAKPDNNNDRSIITKEDNKQPVSPSAHATTEKKEEIPIRTRKVNFLKLVIDWISEHPDKYPKLMYVEFAKYWIETSMSKKKVKLRFEEQRFFDISRRLSTWFQKSSDVVLNGYWESEKKIGTVNDEFKKLL